MSSLHIPNNSLRSAQTTILRRLHKINVKNLTSRMVLRRIQSIIIEESRLHHRTSHLFEAQDSKLLLHLIKKLQVRMLLPRPSPGNRSPYVILLESHFPPLTTNNQLRRKLSHFRNSSCPFLNGISSSSSKLNNP